MSPEALAATRAELDRQHADLEARLEQLAGQILDEEHRHVVAEQVRSLLIDIGMHFGYEEMVMQENAYPEFDHHRRQHIGIMIELAQLLDKVEDMLDPSKAARCVDFVCHWYGQHITHSDHAMEDWLARQSGPGQA